MECPSCKSPLTSDYVEKCADVVLEVIQNVRVCCSSCKHDFPFKELVCHEEAYAGHCSSTTHLPRHTAHEVTLEVVMQTPLDDPLSPDEQVACTHLVKRAMQGGNQLVLKTGGQVRYTHCKNIPVTCKCTKPHTCKYNVHVHVLKFSQSLLLQHTPVPRVLSSEASKHTQLRRRECVQSQRIVVSGGVEEAGVMMKMEVMALTREDRQKLLTQAGIGIHIDATQALAIKSGLSLPWYRIRILRR